MNIVFLVEEPSMKELLKGILPKILPTGAEYKIIQHSGKSDLQKSIPRKLAVWNVPDTKFVILQDQDSADCRRVKSDLQSISGASGKTPLIRIVCRELESWYFGDLQAVSKAYGKDLTLLAKKSKYRSPDDIGNPKEELRKLLPLHQQLSGARKIGPLMKIEKNTSESFQQFVKGLKELIKIKDT